MTPELQEVMEELGLTDFIEVFEEEKVLTVDDFRNLKRADLKDFGIATGPRNQALQWIEKHSSTDFNPGSWSDEKLLQRLQEAAQSDNEPDSRLIDECRSRRFYVVVVVKGSKTINIEQTQQLRGDFPRQRSWNNFVARSVSEYLGKEVLVHPKTGEETTFTELAILTREQLIRFSGALLLPGLLSSTISDFDVAKIFGDDGSDLSQRMIREFESDPDLKEKAEKRVVQKPGEASRSVTFTRSADGEQGGRTVIAGRDHFGKISGNVVTGNVTIIRQDVVEGDHVEGDQIIVNLEKATKSLEGGIAIGKNIVVS